MGLIIHIANEDKSFQKDLSVSLGMNIMNKFRGLRNFNVEFIVLSDAELEYAINTLGAAPVKKPIVSYFGDEAKRIVYNW